MAVFIAENFHNDQVIHGFHNVQGSQNLTIMVQWQGGLI